MGVFINMYVVTLLFVHVCNINKDVFDLIEFILALWSDLLDTTWA